MASFFVASSAFTSASALRSAYLICNYNYAALPALSAALQLMLINHRVLPSSSFFMRRLEARSPA